MTLEDAVQDLRRYFSCPGIWRIYGHERDNLKINRQKHKILYRGNNEEFIRQLVPQKYLEFVKDYDKFKGENVL